MQEAGSVLSDLTNRSPKSHPGKAGRKSLGLTPEEKRKRDAQRKREDRAKKKKTNEEYLKTPEGQAADR